MIHGFELLTLLVETDGSGRPIEYSPHERFAGASRHRLHRYGLGPFGRLRVPDAPTAGGVYAVAVDDTIVYVGRCVNASARWGQPGYGLISPRNCYDGGQSTNCKVNHFILVAAKAGQRVALWFMRTTDEAAKEAELIRRLRPAWNTSQPV